MTLPYDLAKKMLVENDATAAATAMMEGKIKIEGDMGALMQVQQGTAPTAESERLAERIRALTR
jgi:hypothetical protein